MITLTTSGSPTLDGDSTCTIDGAGAAAVQIPDFSLFNQLQGWFAIRLAPTWAATDQPYGVGADPRVFQYHTAVPSGPFQIVFREALDSWGVTRDDFTTNAHIVSTHTANQHVTVIGAWTETLIKISVDGSAFTSLAQTPQGFNLTAPDLLTIGNRSTSDRAVKSVVYWAAMGKGIPTDADAATINAFGDTDPTIAGLPAIPRMLWPAIDFTAENVPDPAVIPARGGHFGPF